MKFSYQKKVNDISLEAELIDKEGTIIKSIKVTNVSDDKINISEKVKDIMLWDIDNPNLYTLNVRLIKNQVTLDCLTETFGFRIAEFKTDGFYLNNKKIKLRGLNRHQSFCNVGYAMPKSMQEKDAEILKYELGTNVVRTSHYPQSRHFINRCDEIGLLVFTEIPGWQHVSENEEWQKLVLKNTEEMILRDRNHPSIILWGVRINESSDCDELYTKTNNLAHLLDPTRATGGVRNFAGSTILENVYTYNDFVHTGKNKPLEKANKISKSKKIPYLVSEHSGHMYPTKRFDHEVKRIEHALRHMRILNEMYGSNRISGAIGWCMFDYNTHKDFGSGDRICYHGVMDMFRIPKLAAYVYSSQQEDIPVMEVASNMEIGDYAGGQLGKVNIFTNCDYVKFYKNDEYIGKFYPDRKTYKYVPHPPIVISDFVGKAIEENERFNPKDAEMIKEVLLAGMTYGMSLPIKYKMKALYLMIKTKITPKEALDLYGRYIGNWGGNIMTYRFEGYTGNKLVKTVTKTALKEARLEAAVDSYDLIEDNTYDVTRVVLSAVSENGNLLNYASDPIWIETEGPIEVIGDKLLSLKGGAVGFYIKTIGQSGKAKIKIMTSNLGRCELEFNVVKIKEQQI